MELKDVILSTLAEMDENSTSEEKPESKKSQTPAEVEDVPPVSEPEQQDSIAEQPVTPMRDFQEHNVSDEALYLESIKERLLVLFEGFQSPNNTQIEAKVDLTLNFLEYLLSTIDSRLDSLKKRG